MGEVAELYDYIVKRLKEWEESSKEDESEKLKKIVAVRVKAYRLKNKLTQDQLAQQLCVSRMQVGRWEDGRHAPGGMAQKILRENKIID